MESDKSRRMLTLESFMSGVPDDDISRLDFGLLQGHPMFSPEALAKAQESIQRVMRGEIESVRLARFVRRARTKRQQAIERQGGQQ